MYKTMLSIDTAMHQTSIAILNNNNIHSKKIYCHHNHEKKILTIIDSLLCHNNIKIYDIPIILFNKGPGYFTSIRIGVNISQGLSMPYNIPIMGISTLKSFAEQAYKKKKVEKIIICIPTIQKKIYWGQYIRKNNQWIAKTQETLLDIEQIYQYINNLKETWYLIGTEKNFFQLIKNKFLKFIYSTQSHAEDLITISQSITNIKKYLNKKIQINYLHNYIT